MLKIEKIADKGRGVVATESIEKGAVIESSPVCQFSSEQRQLISKTPLFDYYFVKPSEYQDGETREDNGYIIFGLASFCNHAQSPNAEIKWLSDEVSSWAQLIALQNIQPAEEITLFYTNIDEYPQAETFSA